MNVWTLTVPNIDKRYNMLASGGESGNPRAAPSTCQ
jgi:hypothetical protein